MGSMGDSGVGGAVTKVYVVLAMWTANSFGRVGCNLDAFASREDAERAAQDERDRLHRELSGMVEVRVFVEECEVT